MTRRQIGLLALTSLTLAASGAMHAVLFQDGLTGTAPRYWTWATWGAGLWYAVPFLGILAAHEWGHLWVARRHGLTVSGPYFLPIGVPLTGTFGSFVRIKSPSPSRAVLLEVAVAGPLLGFLAALPCVILGVAWSKPVWHSVGPVVRFGEPWVVTLAARAIHGTSLVWTHPLAIAGWLGCLVTMLNLVPYGSWDGGHVMTALIGPRRAKAVSWLSLGGAVLLATARHGYTWAAVLVVMVLTGLSGDPVTAGTLTRRHYALAGLVAIVGLLCATSLSQQAIR